MCLCLGGSEKRLLGTGPMAWEGCPTPSCFLRFPFGLRPRLCTCCVPIILGGWQLSLLGHLSQPQRTPYGLPGSSFLAARSACSVSVCLSPHLYAHVSLFQTPGNSLQSHPGSGHERKPWGWGSLFPILQHQAQSNRAGRMALAAWP